MKNKQQNVLHQITKWFQDAIPNPTYNDLCVQMGCHFEEFCEALQALNYQNNSDLFDSLIRTINYCSMEFKNQYFLFKRSLELCDTHPDLKENLVDAMADQIVTAIGVLYMLGVEPEQVLKEVARSNDTKRNPETGEFDRDANGKIIKGVNYKKPNLKPLCSK